MVNVDPHLFETLRNEPFTYDAVGDTAATMPAGYHQVKRSTVIGNGAVSFARACDGLMSWQMHRRAGMRITASSPHADPEAVVEMRLGTPRAGINIPCRVVYQVKEDRRVGFAYGTLPGHPESGEESFVVEHRANDDVVFEVVAFSRPATWFTRLGGPLARVGQALMTRRYARALRRIARAR